MWRSAGTDALGVGGVGGAEGGERGGVAAGLGGTRGSSGTGGVSRSWAGDVSWTEVPSAGGAADNESSLGVVSTSNVVPTKRGAALTSTR